MARASEEVRGKIIRALQAAGGQLSKGELFGQSSLSRISNRTLGQTVRKMREEKLVRVEGHVISVTASVPDAPPARKAARRVLARSDSPEPERAAPPPSLPALVPVAALPMDLREMRVEVKRGSEFALTLGDLRLVVRAVE